MKAIDSNITRRTILAGAAVTFPATAIPALALASDPDPIFAAINAYLPLQKESDAAWKAYTAACDAIAPVPEHNNDFTDDEAVSWRKECERRYSLVKAAPHMRAFETRTDETSDRAIEAADVVYDTMPTTVAGLFLLLKTLGSLQDEDTNSIVGDRWDEYLPRLASAVKSIEGNGDRYAGY